MTTRILRGDCIALMAEMPAESVDAICTDPPYGLEFMGKSWDRLDLRQPFRGEVATPDNPYGRTPVRYPQGDKARAAVAQQEWHHAWALEALRVLKPGGHLLAFGGTRTYHRLACAIEDAGFEIRDCLAWLYGSGFPKSLDVSKAIDKAAGAGRQVIGQREVTRDLARNGRTGDEAISPVSVVGATVDVTAPATPAATRWNGWGTALKPSHEPIVLARKPLTGTVVATVLEYGTGALNVDGCRIANTSADREASMKAMSGDRMWRRSGITGAATFDAGCAAEPAMHEAGRWPANVCLDPEAAAMLDEQTGTLTSGSRAEGVRTGLGYHGADGDGGPAIEGDHGGASRFLYVAKASSAERNAGLGGFEATTTDDGRETPIDNPYLRGETNRRNVHPTVKPIELMRWLCRLVTPPNGVVLDPFAGSGTTGIAAALEGFDFIGCEREPEYADIAEARIAWWAQHPNGVEIVKALEAERKRQAVEATGQLTLA